MEVGWLSVWLWIKAWVWLGIHPGSWLALALLLMQVMGLSRYERKWFATRLTPPVPLAVRTWMLGGVLGVGLSICLLWGEWQIRTADLGWIWACTCILALVRARWACIAYSAGLVILLQGCLTLVPMTGFPLSLQPYVQSLSEVQAVDWLWIVANAHLGEWLLIRLDGSQGAYPVRVKGETSQVTPALRFHKVWPFPLVLGFMPVPLCLGFGCLNYAKPLEQEQRLASTMTLLYALALAGLTSLAEFWTGGIWVAAGFAIAGHEAIAVWNHLRVKKLSPYYVSDGHGIKVIAVIPHSPAASMGIKPGDVIHRVNGKSVPTMAALLQVTEKAAFCKVEVLDEHEDRHIMQKALYEDDPRHLGIIGASCFGTAIQRVPVIRSGATTSQ
ncbi:PDZ domain-containing protein [Laceyella putida]|uniref:PDZ domain-containing protein n=1 Tax=Laceyella putida TaxID=110101 RepID=A0ABW2RG48_9BACL